jgi:hypothetical protein
MNKTPLNQTKRFSVQLVDVTTRVPVTGASADDLTVHIKKQNTNAELVTLVDGVSFFGIPEMAGVYEVVLDSSYIDVEGDLIFHIAESVVGTLTCESVLKTFHVVPESHTTSGLVDMLTRALGLAQENIKIKDHLYDLNGNLIRSDMFLYANQQDLIDEVNPIAEYVMLASYDGASNLVSYEVRKTV